jgi:hypothetical protein
LPRPDASWNAEHHLLELSAQGGPLSKRLKAADLERFGPALDWAPDRVARPQGRNRSTPLRSPRGSIGRHNRD